MGVGGWDCKVSLHPDQFKLVKEFWKSLRAASSRWWRRYSADSAADCLFVIVHVSLFRAYLRTTFMFYCSFFVLTPEPVLSDCTQWFAKPLPFVSLCLCLFYLLFSGHFITFFLPAVLFSHSRRAVCEACCKCQSLSESWEPVRRTRREGEHKHERCPLAS